MLRLLLGKDWTANRDVILDRISRDVRNGQGNRILMVPELISHDTERRLCAAAGDTASRYAEVLSFSRLARRVAETNQAKTQAEELRQKQAEKLEEIYLPHQEETILLDRKSPALHLIQRIRDEAHRFGITFHRKLRSKTQIESALHSIKGVGAKTEQRLLLHFGSVARIATASLDDIAALVGRSLAERILQELNKTTEE